MAIENSRADENESVPLNGGANESPLTKKVISLRELNEIPVCLVDSKGGRFVEAVNEALLLVMAGRAIIG